jgi:hypothetical protein
VLDDGVERGDGGLATLQGEALLADVFRVEEFLEELGLVDAAQDADFERLGEGGLVAGGLHALLEPAAGILVLDVGVFDPDMAAVDLVERRENVAELHLAAAGEVADVEHRVEVGVAEAEVRECELGRGRGRVAERVEVRLDVADRAIGVDEVIDAGLLGGVDDRAGGRAGRGLPVAAEGEALEERAPRRIDRVGVVEPALVIFLDDAGIGAFGNGDGIHGNGIESWAMGVRLPITRGNSKRGTWMGAPAFRRDKAIQAQREGMKGNIAVASRCLR